VATEVRTEHPHVVRAAGVAGGLPVIAGTRIGVAHLARLLKAGEQPADIIAAYPHLAPAAVYDAISYYLDHRAELDAVLDETAPDALARRYGFSIGDKGRVSFARRREDQEDG
jgi:uncharacterized protein (DUF433 family)